MRSLLVATDGSPCSDVAVDFAARLARTLSIPLTIAYVTEPWPVALTAYPEDARRYLMEPVVEAGRALLDEAVKRASNAGALADSVLAQGGTARELLRIASERQVDGIVCGTHGRNMFSRALLGSVSTKVLHLARVPVFVVPSAPERMRRLLVATDGSPCSDAAIDFACKLARRLNAPLTLVHVIEPVIAYDFTSPSVVQLVLDAARSAGDTLLKRGLERCAEQAVTADAVLAEGGFADELRRAAKAREADLIVCGSHARGALGRMVAGSFSTQLAHATPVPLVVVPATEAAAAT